MTKNERTASSSANIYRGTRSSSAGMPASSPGLFGPWGKIAVVRRVNHGIFPLAGARETSVLVN